ncbi:uncharacterized protein LOC143029946 [Oratosquilla oratoria]|uniref:uncharacterized protein LOC143029946 n=1 Tax=Oratosquilla oratoria TaxID=337810 RepID=UPI003F76A3E6
MDQAAFERHPQSQGAVECLNGVIQDKLTIWMWENNSRKLSVGLKFVQRQVNISHHETTGHSPFKVTFGQDPQVGLGSSILSSTALCNIFTEEDLEAEIEVEAKTGAVAEAETEIEGETGAVTEADAKTETVATNFQNIHVSATLGQSKTATRMTRRGKYLLKPLSIVLSLISIDFLSFQVSHL